MIALATSQAIPDLTDDDRLLAEAIRARGVPVVAAVWDDPSVRWADFDRVVIRSTWDYHLRAPEFLAWTEAVPRLWNPAPVVRWNADKRYLFDLERAGVAIVPSALVRAGEDVDAVRRERGWDRAVAKPLVSAGGHGARIVDGPSRAPSELLLQPFVEEIATEGELSFVFLGGAFSHAVRKRPRPGDFRVHEEFGGTFASATPSEGLVGEASAALAASPGPTLYARVDAVPVRGRLFVMEVELIEPELLFRFAPRSADLLASAMQSA